MASVEELAGPFALEEAQASASPEQEPVAAPETASARPSLQE